MNAQNDTRDGLRVVIVEDTRATLQHLVSVISGFPDVAEVAAAETFSYGRELLERPVDILITDISLPDGTGINLIRYIKSKPGTKAVVVTVFGDEKNVIDAIEAGADGYILKDANTTEIATSLSAAISGIAPISSAIAGHLLKRIRKSGATLPLDQPDSEDLGLTKTEVEVLETLAKGFSYKEIAKIRGVSFFTINEHLKSIYKKLAVNSRHEAVYEATRSGIINP